MHIKYKEIPKNNGTYRVVAVPGPAMKRKLQELVPHVTALAMLSDKHDVMHGFVPGRSPVTNARQHIGFRYTMTMDMEDFFLNCGIRMRQLQGNKLLNMIPRECLIEHKDKRMRVDYHPCVQGLPTSPAIANFLFSPIDKNLYASAGMRDIVYTRYADDLAFSGDSLESLKAMRQQVVIACHSHGMPINHKKTRFQNAEHGHRIITGVGVTDTGLVPTRKLKRKLRAARHQGNEPHAAGLEEWCRLKEPDISKYVKSKLEMVRRRFETMTYRDVSRLQASLAVIEIR